jgi:DNA polymerase-3 subunit delta
MARSKNDARLHLVYGAETALCEQWIDAFVRQWRADAHASVDVIDVQDVSLGEAIDALRYTSFFAQRRLVVLKNAVFLSSGKSKVTDADISAYGAYIASPTPDVVLVVFVAVPKLDERKAIVKATRAIATEHYFPPLQEEQCVSWIMRTVHRIEEQAARLLAARVGTSCAMLLQEIEKLVLYVGEGQAIDCAAIDAVVVPSREMIVFSYVDAVIERRAGDALRIVRDLYAQKEEPIKLVFLLARAYRQLVACTDGPQHVVAAPFVLRKLKSQARLYTKHQLTNIMYRLAALDAEIKTGVVSPKIALEQFVLAVYSNAFDQ